MTDPPPQSYAKHLLPLGYGYPLWTPEPSHELLLRRRDGLRIGDVGVIDPENGSFDVFFNICLPREHPLHRVTGVPDNFVPVELDEWDIASFPHAEYPGRVISTSSVTATTIEPSGEATSRPFTYGFSLASSEGALLILPKGAESYKLRKRQMFKDVAVRNAADWYNFGEQHLGRIITHDSLYLITGLYKTSSWSVAVFHQATGTAESSAQFKASHVGEGNNMTYAWETMRALDWRVGPQIDVGMPNQSVFTSGFKISIREGLLGKTRVEVEVDAPPARLRQSVKFSNGRNGSSFSKSGNTWRRLLSMGGSGGRKSVGQNLSATRSDKDPSTTFSLAPQSDDVAGATGHVTINHVPHPLPSFHPSDVVNRYLLSKEPSANVAITHDSQWGILFEKGLLKPEDLGHDGQIERIVSENYRLILQDSAVSLQAICDTSIRLTDVDDAAREAWKEDRLDDVEEILSRQFNRHTGSDHSVFANRALIRARLHHWDAALRDAEMSIDIHPSVVAHVAKGFALFGQEKYESAVDAFNVALRQCDISDRDVVLVIKYVVLFEVGYHAESMAGIADLIGRCPVEVKSAYSAVQVEMYLRLATSATEKKDYNRAQELLLRAQSLTPFRGVPDLKIVSLICGWRFDNLQFTVHRQNCEVLYAAGRTSEALGSLRTITRNFGEGVRTRKDNTEWITAFTQQFLRSLESLGDNAMTSQNYTEAIAHYSMALSTGPVSRDGILIKRGQAYASAHAWEDALKDADEVINSNPLSPLGYERKHAALQGMGRYDEAVRAFNDMLEHSTDQHTQHLSSHRGNLLQSITTIQALSPLTLALPNHPRHTRDHSSVIEPMVTATASQRSSEPALDMIGTLHLEKGRAQTPTGQHIEQQRSVQLEELIPQITALREQLGSNVATAEHNRVLRNQLTDVLNTIARFPHEQGRIISREDDRSQVTGSMPGEQASDVAVQYAQEPHHEPQGILTTPSEHPHDMHVQRYPSSHASPELLRPATTVEVPSGNTGLLTPEGSRPRHYRPDSMTRPMGSSSPDEDRQHLHKSQVDDRLSRSYSPREEHAQNYEFRHNHRPRHRCERREQNSTSDGGHESTDTHDTPPRWYHGPSDHSENLSGIEEGNVSNQHHSLQSSRSIGRNTSRTLPQPSEGLPPVIITRPGTEESSTQSSASQSGIESRTSRWEGLAHGPLGWGVSSPVSPVHTDPVSMTEDVRSLRRQASSRTHSSRRSSERSEYRGSLGEAPTSSRYQAPQGETIVQPPVAANVQAQHPGVWGAPSIYSVMSPGQMLAQPQAPLHDTLLEILREQRFAHRASIDQQQELTRQMRSLSEWLMREMQDRLAELRGMTGRTNPYPYPPREEQMGHAQSHHGVSGTGSVPPIPGTPWSAAWYPPPPGSAYTTPTSATLYSSTPYQGPFMPRPSWLTQQSPYVPPGPFIPEFGEFTAPQRPGTSQGNDELAPSFGSRYISSPVVTKLSPPASKPALDSEPTSSTAQAASNALTQKSLLLGAERGSPTSMASPLSTLSTHLRVPEYDSPKKSTLPVRVGDEGDPKVAKAVTFAGEVTYI